MTSYSQLEDRLFRQCESLRVYVARNPPAPETIDRLKRKKWKSPQGFRRQFLIELCLDHKPLPEPHELVLTEKGLLPKDACPYLPPADIECSREFLDEAVRQEMVMASPDMSGLVSDALAPGFLFPRASMATSARIGSPCVVESDYFAIYKGIQAYSMEDSSGCSRPHPLLIACLEEVIVPKRIREFLEKNFEKNIVNYFFATHALEVLVTINKKALAPALPPPSSKLLGLFNLTSRVWTQLSRFFIRKNNFSPRRKPGSSMKPEASCNRLRRLLDSGFRRNEQLSVWFDSFLIEFRP